MISIEFTKPFFLWLLLLIPVLIIAHYFFLKRTRTKAMRFANFAALKRIAGDKFITKNTTLLVLRIIIFLLFIVSLSGTLIWHDGQRNDFDYVLAIDSSASMLTQDFSPNRLGAAKESALSFLDTLSSETEVGLVTFSGVTYVRQDLTTNKAALKIAIELVNVSRNSGTDLSGAIVTATNMLSGTSDNRGKAIILFSDGIDTAGTYVDNNILQAINYAKSQKIVIHTVGLGTKNAPVGYLPEIYNLTSSIDKDSLQLIANNTGGSSIFPQTQAQLIQHFLSLNNHYQETSLKFDVSFYALLAALFLLVIEWTLINLRYRRVT